MVFMMAYYQHCRMSQLIDKLKVWHEVKVGVRFISEEHNDR